MNVKTVESPRVLNIVLAALLLFGGLNWGLIGLFHFDLIAEISGRMEFGETNLFSRLTYSLLGVAAVVAGFLGFSSKGFKQLWNLTFYEGLDVPAFTRRKGFITLPSHIPSREESKPKT